MERSIERFNVENAAFLEKKRECEESALRLSNLEERTRALRSEFSTLEREFSVNSKRKSNIAQLAAGIGGFEA